MKYLTILLAVFFLSACGDEEVPIDAKYLALNACTYTGNSFENTETIWVSVGRVGSSKEVTKRYYLYLCEPGERKVLSTTRLVLDKE